MIGLVTKFLSWVKSIFSLVVSLPSKFVSFATFVSDMLGFLPNGVGTVIAILLLTCVTFVMVYAVVRLVINLL